MRRAGALLLAALASSASGVAAQPALDAVVVDIGVEAAAPVQVAMTYFLRPAGAADVGFGSIHVGGHRVANVRAFLGEREVSFRLRPDTPDRVDGRVDLPPELGSADRIRVRLVYDVLPAPPTATGERLVPLLVAEWPPPEAVAETFRATVRLPAELSVASAFPTRFERLGPDERSSAGGGARFDLPVVPAFLRLELASGPPPSLTFERAIDLAALALLIALALFGWRRLREHLR